MNRKIFIFAVTGLFVDQITKILVFLFFQMDTKVTFIKNFLEIQPIENYGAAWSLFNNKTGFLIGVSFIALLVVIKYMYSFQCNKRNNLAFGLVLSGIVGNLIDRVFLGYVRDFFSFQIFHSSFPIFNFADVFIVLGTVMLIYAIIKGEDKNAVHCSKNK